MSLDAGFYFLLVCSDIRVKGPSTSSISIANYACHSTESFQCKFDESNIPEGLGNIKVPAISPFEYQTGTFKAAFIAWITNFAARSTMCFI